MNKSKVEIYSIMKYIWWEDQNGNKYDRIEFNMSYEKNVIGASKKNWIFSSWIIFKMI